MLTGLVMPLSNIGAGVVVWARGYRPARFYLLAFSLLAVFVYIYVFQGLGLIPATRFTNMSMTLGAALEALFLAFALADRIRHLQQEKDAAKERETLFKSLSQTDPLTGLFNQRVLTERLAAELDQARIHHGPLSVIMMDLDHFKDYNDRYGHPEGDQVLKALAGVIRTSIRDTDCPCRYGGEEFTVILPGTRAEHAAAVAERIRRSLADQVFEPTPGREEHVTVSLGVTEHRPDDTAPNLIARADQALYQAKTDGRNRTSRV
jgi:diguanylate cyclase (GGDEF)-like protein